MTAKTNTPEALREQADKLAQQAAAVQAEIDAQSLREYEREQEAQRKADQELVDTFRAADVERDVEEARQALSEAVAALPVTQALGTYLAAQYRRNWAYVDLQGARARLGMPDRGTRQSSTIETALGDLVMSAARDLAQQAIDAERGQA